MISRFSCALIVLLLDDHFMLIFVWLLLENKSFAKSLKKTAEKEIRF